MTLAVTGTPRNPGDKLVLHANLPVVHIEAQGQLMAMRVRLPDAGGAAIGGTRGVIREYSRQSRMRMLKQFARLDARRGVFLTLTYPSRFPAAREAKSHLRALLERFRRRYPKASAVWRLEYQDRGAPHFHLVFFDLPYVPFRLVRQWWSDIVSDYVDEYAPRVRIEMIRSRNGVMHYAAKYCAKTDQVPAPAIPVSLSLSHICTLLLIGASWRRGIVSASIAYRLMCRVIDSAPYIGRYWGVFNRPALPQAPRAYTAIEVWDTHAIADAQNVMREIWGGIADDDKRGGVLFTPRAYSIADSVITALIPGAGLSGSSWWLMHRRVRDDKCHKVCSGNKDRRRIYVRRIRQCRVVRWTTTE